MPRLVFKIPKYSLHRASGQARVKYNGRTIYLGKHGSQESREAYAQFVANLPKPEEEGATFAEPSPGVTLLVGEIALRYLAHARAYYARDGVPTGEHVTIRSALKPLVKRFGELPVNDLGPKRLKEVRADMIKLGWCRHYVNKATSIIKRCFKWAESEELVPKGTSHALETVSGLGKGRSAAREKPPVEPVDDNQVEAIYPHVSELVGDILRTMRLTGMRPGEALSMTAAQIDRTDPSCWIYRPGHHKTEHHGKGRTVFIGERAQELVLPRILKAGDGGRLFPMTPSSLRTAIIRGCQRAGVPRFAPNRIRHTVGTEVRSKFGLEAAQVLLGHSRADVTQTYAERDMSKAADIARKIG